MAFQYRQNMQQQVPEIAGIHVPKTRLISGIELLPPAIGIALAHARADLLRGQALVLPLVDEAGELAGGPALFVDALRLDRSEARRVGKGRVSKCSSRGWRSILKKKNQK